MDLTPHLEAIRADLESLADEQTAAALERLVRAVEPALQLRMLDVLGEASLEISEQLPTGHAEVRVAGRDARVVYVGEALPEPTAPSEDDEGGTARLTLRMPEGLKIKVEATAAREGLSVNAWLVRTITRGVDGKRFELEFGRSKRGGSKLTGWAES
jgi:hypothetical protein